MTDTKVMAGKIIKVHKDGWGFISSREVPFTRIFFHWHDLHKDTLKFPDLKTGMLVEFMPHEIPEKGYRAFHIKVTDKHEKKVEGTNEETNEGNNVSALPE